MSSRDEVESQAALWLAREDRGIIDAAARDAWLEESTANRVAYLRLKSAWRRANRLAALRAPAPQHRPVMLLNLRSAYRYAAAAALVLALGVGFILASNGSREIYATKIGAREIVALSDGSKIELNTDTELRTKVTETNRLVTLERGEAFFDVVHDEKRPFIVLAGGKRIIDVGTKFSVRREGENVDVLVSEGQVRIEDLSRPEFAPVLAKKDRLVIAKFENTLVVPKTPQEIANSLGWRRGMLIFAQESLNDVAAEFNRYNEKRLVIAEGQTANIRIGGSFDANNVEAFARLVRDGFHLKIKDDGTRITISE